MPTYEYSCNECRHIFEYFQKMTDDLLKVCPECSGSVTRLIGGGSGLIFKGSGFYITDYKKKSKSTNSSDSKSDSKKNKQSSTKSKATEVKKVD
ncbi:MAG: zinc ribbon domain-containing protein [Candidatus Marinimicrobia bacterium]|nr:zinc ribbon domain-containing protein [Candidatus Neomarinimicrobiota bacterium]MDP6568609.1 zinc ribbon domain-containing protein [Candidatus Neomarinimicrobiota bacterium]MDP7026606.1 zinc ribbon domain-containing protein [Candidatus Neomarinimicrobiota bacterium]